MRDQICIESVRETLASRVGFSLTPVFAASPLRSRSTQPNPIVLGPPLSLSPLSPLSLSSNPFSSSLDILLLARGWGICRHLPFEPIFQSPVVFAVGGGNFVTCVVVVLSCPSSTDSIRSPFFSFFFIHFFSFLFFDHRGKRILPRRREGRKAAGGIDFFWRFAGLNYHKPFSLPFFCWP